MRIQHNILAMNAYRNYNTNTSALAKNLEKLSSGYKINRAGDDAAGLAISEKMRAQITGLNAAQKNVKDGISLVKTAEGAMQEIQDMLNRMDYLATQSANGTYQDEVDRENLNKEMSALKTEINRIADSANFNGIKLLDGSLDTNIKAQDAVTETVTIDPTKSEALTFESGKLAEEGQVLGTNTVRHNEANGSTGTSFSVDLHNFKFDGGKNNTMTIKMGDSEITLKATEDHGKVEGADLVNAFLGANGYEITVDGKKVDTLDGMQINGQTFEVKAGTENTSRLTFTQKEAPASKDQEINGSMEVNISGKVEPKKAEFTFTATDLGTPTIGGVVTINGKSYTIKDTDTTGTAPTAQTWAEVFKDMEKEGVLKDYKVTEDNGKVTLTAKEAGKMNTPTVSYKATQAATGITGNQVAGVDGVKSKYTSGALTVSTGGTITDGEVATLTVNYTDATGTAQTKDISYTIATGDAITNIGTGLVNALKADKDLSALFDISGGGGGIILEAKEMGTGKGAVTGITLGGDAATGTTKLALATGAAVSGVDATKDTWTYDVTGWNDSALGPVTLTDANNNKLEIDFDKLNAAGERGLKVGEYIATIDGNTLTLTAQKAGASGGQGPTTNGTLTNAISYNTYTAPVKLTADQIDVVEEGAEGGEMQGITEGAHGDFNVSTTAIDNVTAGGADRLASTYFDLTEDMVKDGSTIKIGEKEYTFTTDEKKIAAGSAGNVTFVDARGDLAATAKNLTDAAKGNDVWTVGHDGNRITLTETVEHAGFNDTVDYDQGAGFKFDLSTKAGIEKSLGFTGAGSYTKEEIVSEAVEGGKALNLQIGDTSDEFNQMKVAIGDMHVKAMGTFDKDGKLTKSIDEVDILNPENAAEAVDVIKNAINYVSSVRGDLGAYQNRLEHTANNLSVMAENIQDAESTIRDTDVAEEMMAYTKNNILIQSAQAMLAQANAVPQGVLQLLG